MASHVDQVASGFITGKATNLVSGAAATPLVPSATPCKRVFLMAPKAADGTAVNTNPIFFGDSMLQDDTIAADGSRDRMIHIDDASKIYVKSTHSGDYVNFRIEL